MTRTTNSDSSLPSLLTPVHIPERALRAVYDNARAAFPGECCGWLSGPSAGWSASEVHLAVNVQTDGGHPTHPGRGVESAYVFSTKDLLALSESLEGEHPARVIYHSHPNGKAYLSEIDRKVATSPWGDGPAFPVQQLVVGVEDGSVVESALFAWSDADNAFVEVARFASTGGMC